MFLTNGYEIFADAVLKQGKESLARQYPRDFEVYMCALELVDPEEQTVDYFLFPVMPTNISKTETEATTVQTSLTGITIFNKQGYTPDEISIQGNFGRSFKLLSFENDAYYKGVAGYAIEDGFYTADQINAGLVDKKLEFPFGIKTGFGCIKILQSIIHKAKAHGPTGLTYKLYFYNLALGESYLVVPSKQPLTLSQNEQSSNMIWQYQLNLVIVADMADVANKVDNRRAQDSLSAEQLLGGISSTKTLLKQYTGLVTSVI